MELSVANPVYDRRPQDRVVRQRALFGLGRIWNQTEDDADRGHHRFP